MKKGDYIVLAVSLILVVMYCVLQYSFEESGKYAEISIGKAVVQRVPLDENNSYSIEDTSITVTVCDGGVYVSDSGCPDRLCMESGKISSVGKSIVCLPQRVIIRIVGQTTVDEVSGEVVG